MKQSTAPSASLDQVYSLLQAEKGQQALASLEQARLLEKEQRFLPATLAFYLHLWALAQVGWFSFAAALLLPTVPSSEEPEVQELARALLGTDLRQQAPVWFFLGALADWHGRTGEALVHYRRCLAALDRRRMNLPGLRLRVLSECGRICMEQAAFARASTFYEQALEYCDDTAARPLRLQILMDLCEASLRRALYAQAQTWGTQAFPLAYEQEDREAQVLLLCWLGDVHARWEEGEQARACACYQEAQHVAQRVKLVALEVVCLARLAAVKLRQQAYDSTYARCLEALALV